MPTAERDGSPEGGFQERGPRGRVLVVDDEPGIRLVLGRGLARYDYKVFLADSATEALRLLRDDLVVDAVVTDITMPAMSGVQLAEEILRRHPGVPILFVTASHPPAQLLADPLVDLVEKPVRIAHVQDRLGELIARASAAQATASVGTATLGANHRGLAHHQELPNHESLPTHQGIVSGAGSTISGVVAVPAGSQRTD